MSDSVKIGNPIKYITVIVILNSLVSLIICSMIVSLHTDFLPSLFCIDNKAHGGWREEGGRGRDGRRRREGLGPSSLTWKAAVHE